jgi:hypothetical protein
MSLFNSPRPLSHLLHATFPTSSSATYSLREVRVNVASPRKQNVAFEAVPTYVSLAL